MNFLERAKINKFIKTYEKEIVVNYAKNWEYWKSARDRIAIEQKLNEEQVLLLTQKEIAGFMVNIIRSRLGLNGPNKESAIKTRGNTREFEILKELGEVFYDCQRRLGKVDANFVARYKEMVKEDSKPNNGKKRR